jgi:SH3-like domain-containing protein
MGTEVEILEDRDGWLRIELANGREAWVRSSSVKRVIDG